MRTLLLIVDDWESLEWYEDRLQQDFQVTCAPFGSEGIRLAQELQPDLIFLDLVFEDMTPIEAFQNLQDNPKTKEIPTILILNPEDTLAFQFPEKTSALTRPFQFEDLLKTMKSSPLH
jgi:CheY-like chemotaxis protein